MKRAFVAWDFEIPGLGVMLESVAKRPPAGMEFVVPARGTGAGEILADIVLPGIRSADLVLALVDHPSPNVGFEIGLAIGLGKPVAMAHYADARPAWIREPPLKSQIAHRVDDLRAVRDLLQSPHKWLTAPPAPPAPGDGGTLFLCPDRHEGSGCLEEQQARMPGWRTLPAAFRLRDLPALVGPAARLVWTLSAFPPQQDGRDLATHAANAVVAGWYYATLVGAGGMEPSDPADGRFVVVRSAAHRPVVDVALHEREFEDIQSFAGHLDAIRVADPATALVGFSSSAAWDRDIFRAAARRQVEREIHVRAGAKFIPTLCVERPLEREIDAFERAEPKRVQVMELLSMLTSGFAPLEGESRARWIAEVEGLAIEATWQQACEWVKAYTQALPEHDRSRVLDAMDQIGELPRTCFLIADRAGSGKTNMVCRRALAASGDTVAIFLTARSPGAREGSLVDMLRLALDRGFELLLPDVENVPKLPDDRKAFLAELGATLHAHGLRLLVYVDGINEHHDLEGFDEALVDGLSALAALPARVIVTCRDIFWSFFDAAAWQPFLWAHRIHALPELGRDVIHDIVDAYFQHFGIKGRLGAAARERCRHPLLLRFFCEAYRGRDVREIEDLRLKDLFEEYWRRKRDEIATALSLGTDGGRLVERYLFAMVDMMREQHSSALTVDEVTGATGDAALAGHNSIYQRLLDEDVIFEELPAEDAFDRSFKSRRVVFVYDEFYDFMMAMAHVRRGRWDELEPPEIAKAMLDRFEDPLESDQLRGIAEYLVLMGERNGLNRVLCALLARLGEYEVLCSVLPKHREVEPWMADVLATCQLSMAAGRSAPRRQAALGAADSPHILSDDGVLSSLRDRAWSGDDLFAALTGQR